MKCSLRSFWRVYLLCCLGLLWYCGEARVLTEIQAGPLYRVVGSPLFISCNVSGFTNNNTEKNFQFRISKPEKPSFEINIISTDDPNFGYAIYQDRVRSNEITLTRVSPNSVIFKIISLQKNDEGDYDCTAVNEESTYDGTYSVKTTVKVIDNSLSVSSPPHSTSLSYNEGDALSLTCQASSNTVQHTHLSLTWYLRKADEDDAQPIISLDRDFTLSPGKGFEGRYQAGLIMLDKVGEATYRLKMTQVELSDEGKIYCRADEWIQDPDRSWYSITQKDAEETTLHVKAKEVVLDTASLVVRISAQQTTLQEGQELSLSCHVDTQNLEERFFSVAWLWGSVELARIGPTGILSFGSEYSSREKDGELRAARIRNGEYRLILQPVRTKDQGEYVCRAWPQERGQDGAFKQGAAQDSSSQLISISTTESGLSVEMQSTVSVNEGDRLNLTCKVQGVKDQLSVNWQRKLTSTSTATFTDVIGLSQEGVIVSAEEFVNRKVKAMRPATDTFTLELDEVTVTDSGVYQCTVSEWKANSKTKSQSKTATVTVAPTESLVRVNLKSRRNMVTVGENVELMCRVKGPRLQITLTWSLQRDASTLDNILTLHYNGAISWSGDQHRYQLKVKNEKDAVTHYLLINGASHREAGKYQCGVSVFMENAYKKLPPSNQLAVMVQNPVSQLVLTSTPLLTRNINTDIEIKCSITSAHSASFRYAVTWVLQQKAKNTSLVSYDRDSLVTFGPQVDRQRISMRRTEGPSFELTIRQTRISDSGSYVCEVVEWLQDPRGEWYKLSQVSKSTELTLIEPVSKLVLTSTPLLTRNINTDIEIKFSITSAYSASSRYAVTWVLQQKAKNTSLVSSDRDSLVTFGPQVDRQRISMRRTEGPSFELTIRQTRISDSGSYVCEVVEWLQDPRGEWYKLSQVSKSTELTLIEPGDALSDTGCKSDIWMGAFIGVIIFSLFIILLLVLKKYCDKGSEKKSGQSLWAEQYPLNTKPVVET
ncbi:immunoglobulin superfamily member 2-like isoform X2 [Thunnus thynnus]|uniref:immunoglobulin superfamily member 2-like isoform X2 n=1 Tax=Thunnus thynnus TaxID=8237 RepID=UPI003528E9BF